MNIELSIISQDMQPGGSRHFIRETDFVFNSDRWMTSVLPESCPFSPRYTHLLKKKIIIQLVHIYPGSCESVWIKPWSFYLTCHFCVYYSHTFVCVCVYMQMANLADADVSEEDKIRVMINQSTYDSMKWVTSVVLSYLLPHPHFCLLGTFSLSLNSVHHHILVIKFLFLGCYYVAPSLSHTHTYLPLFSIILFLFLC